MAKRDVELPRPRVQLTDRVGELASGRALPYDCRVPLYDLPLFRPPSEADSAILQVTLGCSHNRCGFCSMYRTKRFRPVPLQEIESDLERLRAAQRGQVRRVFLADGDAMCLSFARLSEILDRVNGAFPRLQRISIYANARDLLARSPEELAALRDKNLRLVYTGLESGDDETLAHVQKGASSGEIVEAVRRAQDAGINASVMVLIGVAGRARSLEHARASAEAINRMAPMYTALLTYTPTPGSPMFEEIERGELELPGPLESLQEIHEFVRRIECKTWLTCNHASNYLPLKGHMPSAGPAMLERIEAALDGAVPLRAEWMRGL